MPDAEHPLQQRFVLDTSAFVTDEIREEGEEMEDAIERLLELVRDAKLSLGITCHFPPSIRDELGTILEGRDGDRELRAALDAWVVTKPPARHRERIPADVVYDFIDEMNDRVNKGLRVSEKAVRSAGTASDDTIDGSEHVTEVDEVVSDLRNEYRSALRQGVLDSREDFDLLVLARELDACVVTEDRGILEWAEEFGLRYRKGREFPELLRRYLATDRDG